MKVTGRSHGGNKGSQAHNRAWTGSFDHFATSSDYSPLLRPETRAKLDARKSVPKGSRLTVCNGHPNAAGGPGCSPSPGPAPAPEGPTKRCTRCKAVKGVGAFPRDASRRDGLNNWCRACKSAHDQGRKA